MTKKFIISFLISAVPIILFAQTPNYVYQGPSGVVGLFSWLSTILRMILPLIVSLAVVWFVYSVFRYTVVDNEEDKTEAKRQILWGIVGIFVMVSVWGLVNILSSTFRLDTSGINAPIIRLNN